MAFDTYANFKLYVSDDLPATNNQAGFEAVGVVWTEVGNVTAIQVPSVSYAEVSLQPLGNRLTQYEKGSKDYSALTADMGYLASDAGQTLLIAAHNSDVNYSFKVEYASGEKRYMVGKVFNLEQPSGGIDDVVMMNMSVRVDADVVRVTA